MLCVNPYRTGKEEFGCGKCLPCRFTKRRVWVGRIMLELQAHRHSAFVTLTYKDAPDDFSEHDVRLCLKALRRRYGRIRYLLVGERGTKGGRVHYHMALFGVSPTESRGIGRCWSRGFVDVGELNSASAHYLVKYLLKDGERFRRMSLKPGIGGLLVNQIGARLEPHFRSGGIEDVPPSIRVAGREVPVGRYVRKKVRAMLGRDERTPVSVRLRQQEDYGLQDSAVRECKRENTYLSALQRLEIMKTKEKL